MGNAISSEGLSNNKGQKDLPQVLNYIASNYIVTQNFQDMVNLRDPKYCDKLVILTSDIINKYLNTKQVEYLAQKTKDGVPINEIKKDNILYMTKEDYEKLDIRTKIYKKRLCIGIAKFYIKIAHIFSAILSTINPVYSYKNTDGEVIKVPLERRNEIPKDVNSQLTRVNICSERINALINKKDFKNDNIIKVKPNFCEVNMIGNKIKNLNDEPGIPELEVLYYDEYDLDEGVFKTMSTNMKKKYLEDVKLFYKHFTNNDNMPDEIKKFSDIKLRNFNINGICDNKNNLYLKEYTGNTNNKLFKNYADHINSMMNRAKENQNKLLKIIDELFVWSIEHSEQKKQIIINPNLDEEKLDKIIDETRQIIISCYITCEEDFLKGIKIFEAIVEKQIIKVGQMQIKNLEDNIKKKLVQSPFIFTDNEKDKKVKNTNINKKIDEEEEVTVSDDVTEKKELLDKLDINNNEIIQEDQKTELPNEYDNNEIIEEDQMTEIPNQYDNNEIIEEDQMTEIPKQYDNNEIIEEYQMTEIPNQYDNNEIIEEDQITQIPNQYDNNEIIEEDQMTELPNEYDNNENIEENQITELTNEYDTNVDIEQNKITELTNEYDNNVDIAEDQMTEENKKNNLKL